MDAVAYIDPAVIAFISENFVPLRLQASDPVLGPQFRVKWTPTLMVLDTDGSEHYRTLGFYPPDDLIPSLLLGLGKLMFDRPDRPAAVTYFKRLISDYPRHSLTPEAVYLKGVSNYIETHEVSHLIEIYDRLLADHHESPWLTRADPYKLLKKPA